MLATFLEFLMGNGVPEYTIVLLLYLPIVATIVTFTRYVLGWKSLTVYAALSLTFAIYEIARVGANVDVLRGLGQGGAFITIATFASYFLQSVTHDFRIHYLAKVSLVLAFLTGIILAVFYFFIQLQGRTFLNISPVALLMIILVTDIFIKGYLRKGPEKSAQLITQTIVLSYGIFFIIAQPAVKNFVLTHPEVVLYTVLVNIIVGRWRGFRLSEYFRFKNIKLPDVFETYDTEYTEKKR